MPTIWKILNSPLVVVLIALAAWPLLSSLSANMAVRSVIGGVAGDISGTFSDLSASQNRKDKGKMAAIGGVKISDVKMVASPYKTRQKFIGTIRNAGSKTIKQIKVTATYYSEGNTLIDVDSTWLSDIAFLEPGKSASFAIKRSINRQSGTPASRVSIAVTSVGIVEKAGAK